MKKYDTYNHAKCKILYHIVFSVKYHRKILKYIIDDLKCSFQRAQKLYGGWKIRAVETDLDKNKDHHIHLLIKAKPSVSVTNLVKQLKQISTQDVWEKHGDYLSRIFYRGKKILWSRGYFCCTIGDCSDEIIKKYIENQG